MLLSAASAITHADGTFTLFLLILRYLTRVLVAFNPSMITCIFSQLKVGSQQSLVPLCGWTGRRRARAFRISKTVAAANVGRARENERPNQMYRPRLSLDATLVVGRVVAALNVASSRRCIAAPPRHLEESGGTQALCGLLGRAIFIGNEMKYWISDFPVRCLKSRGFNLLAPWSNLKSASPKSLRGISCRLGRSLNLRLPDRSWKSSNWKDRQLVGVWQFSMYLRTRRNRTSLYLVWCTVGALFSTKSTNAHMPTNLKQSLYLYQFQIWRFFFCTTWQQALATSPGHSPCVAAVSWVITCSSELAISCAQMKRLSVLIALRDCGCAWRTVVRAHVHCLYLRIMWVYNGFLFCFVCRIDIQPTISGILHDWQKSSPRMPMHLQSSRTKEVRGWRVQAKVPLDVVHEVGCIDLTSLSRVNLWYYPGEPHTYCVDFSYYMTP